MRTKQLRVKLAAGEAHLFVGDGCGEIQVQGFAPKAGLVELRAKLQIEPQFMGAWDCKDGNAAIDYRVPCPSWRAVTVEDVVKRLGRRWTERMIANGNPSDSSNYHTV